MQVRVPLLLCLTDAIVHRRDPIGTRGVDPPGPATDGFDDIFREPVAFDTGTGSEVDTRNVTLLYLPPIRVKCQVETTLFDDLRQAFSGGLRESRITLVLHRQDLLPQGLINTKTGNIKLGIGDKVTGFERHGLGVPTVTFPEPGLFIQEIRPASFGFGPDGHDLHLVVLEQRNQGST
jgi:hypothetical protein